LARERREAKRTPASWAARIVARSGVDCPADRELRSTLRNIDLLKPEDARWISRAVFSYFRWLGWLDQGRSLEKRLDQAMGFADTYARNPAVPCPPGFPR
jgi:16S rRNA (cytosine967-C5)-methyltransferase